MAAAHISCKCWFGHFLLFVTTDFQAVYPQDVSSPKISSFLFIDCFQLQETSIFVRTMHSNQFNGTRVLHFSASSSKKKKKTGIPAHNYVSSKVSLKILTLGNTV